MSSTVRPSARRSRIAVRLAVAGAATAAALIGAAGPAAAHVEVTAKPARQGAANAVVTFVAEAESQTAGVTGVTVQLPQGIAPADVTLASAPRGWRLAATADGYTVTGAAIPPGQDLTYAIRVRQLPTAATVAFKTIQAYSDGKQDAWIEIAAPGAAEPEMPAPTLTLAAAPTTPPATTAAAPSPAPTTVVPTATAGNTPTSADDGAPGWLWLGLAAAAALITAGALKAWRRTRPQQD